MERKNVEGKSESPVRAEVFDVATHTSFSSVYTGYGSGNFDAVPLALDPHILEFVLRATF
jgi:hypothetical protein